MARAIHILRTFPKARVVTTVLLNVWTCFVCPWAKPLGCSSLTWVSLPVCPPLWDLSTRVVLMVSSCRACSVDANNPGEGGEEDRYHPLTDGETALGGAAEVCRLARSHMLIRPLVWSLGRNSYLKVRRCTSLEGRWWLTRNWPTGFNFKEYFQLCHSPYNVYSSSLLPDPSPNSCVCLVK